MSSLARLFRRSCSTAAPANTTANASTMASVKSLFEERNLKSLVEKFKQYSHSDRFRMKIGIYENTVRRLASAKKFKWIEEILEYQKQFKDDIAKEGFSVRLITLYGKSQMFENAQKVFDEMPEVNCPRTVRSMNALLGACISSRKYEEAERLFRELTEKLNVKPDLFSYNIVLKGLCQLGSHEKVTKLIEEMEKEGIEPDLVTFNTVFISLYSSGKFAEGEELWNRMAAKNVVPDIRSYNARLLGLAKEGKMKEAEKCLEELGNKGFKADVFSYGALIRGYSFAGDLEEVKRCYRELEEKGFAPEKGIFWNAGSLACEKGDYDWAFELCKDVFDVKCIVDMKLLQRVVDGLVKESRISEAEELVKLGKSNNYRRYDLKLSPSKLCEGFVE